MGKGFFSTEEVTAQRRVAPPPARRKRAPSKAKLDCEKCGLYKTCLSPKMSWNGKGKRKVLWMGEAPGEEEDENGKQWVGEVGRLLRRSLEKHTDISLAADCWHINALNCRPPDNKTPTNTQINCCREVKIKPILDELKPDFVVLSGNAAIQSYWAERGLDNRVKVSQMRGKAVPDRQRNCWVFHTYHPSFINRNERKDENLIALWERDLKQIAKRINTWSPPDLDDPADFIEVTTEFDRVIEVLQGVLDSPPPFLVLDYETSGLKPHKAVGSALPRHMIHSISIAFNGHAYSFPFEYPKHFTEDQQAEIAELWVRVLQSSTPKIAHNIKFEDMWSRCIPSLKCEPAAWEHDTMVCTHILDNQRFLAGLKTQALLQYGVEDYDREFKNFREGVLLPEETEWNRTHKDKKKVSSYHLNRVHEMPLPELLKYGGFDAILELWLYEDQLDALEDAPRMKKAQAFFHEALLAFMDMQDTGIDIDEDWYDQEEERLLNEIERLSNQLLRSPEAKRFHQKTGKIVDLNSTDDIRDLMYNVLGMTPPKETKTGRGSVDAESLGELDHPFAKRVVERRKKQKIVHTYIDQIRRETANGRIFPIFNLHIPTTYRSCIAKGALVEVVRDIQKHPDGIPIEEVRPGDLAYCYDDDLKPTIRRVVWAGKTGRKRVIRIHWKARGKRGYVDLTPEHLVRHVSGKWIQAQHLDQDHRTAGDSKQSPKCNVLGMGRVKDHAYFTRHIGPHNTGVHDHRFVYEHVIGKLDEGLVVHHRDGNHYNNNPENLEAQTRTDHSRHHNVFNLPHVREKNREVVRKLHREGKYEHIYKRGEEHHLWLGLTRFQCLRLLAKASGRPTRVDVDFDTLKKHLNIHGIDHYTVRARYSANGEFVSRGRLKRAWNEHGYWVHKAVGLGYYRTRELISYYGLEGVPGNHIITSVEWIDKTTDVYDIEVEEFHNFIANGVCVHNSCQDPNMQNTPKREEEPKKAVRRGIITSLGNKLLELDFGGIEVCGLAWYSQDKALLDYLHNPNSDLHRDQAQAIFDILPDEWAEFDPKAVKTLRFYAKNQWNFPLFYGSYYKSCAQNVWDHCSELPVGDEEGTNVRQWMGMSFESYRNHLKKKEKQFWKQFQGVRDWQNELGKGYRKKGFVETFFGFRYQGYLSRNDLYNWPVQGTAFHLLLWCMIQANKERKQRGWKSNLMFQIHDSIGWNLVPDEQEEVVSVCRDIMENRTRETFKWINTPLTVEPEITDVNGSFYDLKELVPDEDEELEQGEAA